MPLAPCRSLRGWYPLLLILHGLINGVLSRISGPHWFNADPILAFFSRYPGLFCKCKRNLSWELSKNFFSLALMPVIWSKKSRDNVPLISLTIISVADPGCYPGSDFFPSRIQIFPSRMVSKLQEIWSGLFIFIPDSGSGSFFCHPSRIQGSKRHRILDPDPQHWQK